jgi:hypothetical protein
MNFKGYVSLLLFSAFLTGAGYVIISAGRFNILISDLAILVSCFTLISLIVLIIFFSGQKKNPESQTLHTLAAISSKMLLEMLFALIWFITAKKNSGKLVLLFFVLYLAFTLYSVFIILNTLKTKSIDNKIELENF